jgi:hypothetical protein
MNDIAGICILYIYTKITYVYVCILCIYVHIIGIYIVYTHTHTHTHSFTHSHTHIIYIGEEQEFMATIAADIVAALPGANPEKVLVTELLPGSMSFNSRSRLLPFGLL